MSLKLDSTVTLEIRRPGARRTVPPPRRHGRRYRCHLLFGTVVAFDKQFSAPETWLCAAMRLAECGITTTDTFPDGFNHRVARGSEQIEDVFHPKRWVWLSLLICEYGCSGLIPSCSDMKPPSHEIRAFQEKSWDQNGCYSPLLPVALEFLSDHTSQCGLQDAFLRLDVLAKCGINHGLVVTAPGCVHLIPEPLQDIVVDPDGDLGFSGLRRNDWATSSPAEIVTVFHLVFTFFHIRTFRIDRPCEPR